VLLGIEPDDPDPEYGWIVPAVGGDGLSRSVSQFVEKPDAARSARLMADGALVNSFIFVATARHLLRLYEESLPSLLRDFLMSLPLREWGREAMQALYRFLPARDFSRDLLQPLAGRLRVLEVPACGWTDLGTPMRVARWMETHRPVAAGTKTRRRVPAALRVREPAAV
jgi:mannose-1-phosphate guanylyltransferase